MTHALTTSRAAGDSDDDSVVAIVGAFFLMGITVGIIAVVAMSAVRADRAYRANRPSPAGQFKRPAGVRASGPVGAARPDWDDAGPDDHPHWPGDSDNDFSS